MVDAAPVVSFALFSYRLDVDLVINVVTDRVQFELPFYLKMLLCNLGNDIAFDLLSKFCKLRRYSSLVIRD